MSKKLLGMGRGMGRGLARKPGVMANGNAGTNDTNTSSFNSSPGSKGEVDWGRTSPSAGINSSDGNSWNPVPDSSDSFSRSSNGGGDSRGRAGFSNGVGSGGGRQGGGSGGGRQGGGGGKGCFKCGEDGHMARDCPNADSSGSRSGGGTSGGCRKCGEEGHFARDCPQGGGGGGRDGCRKCGEEGHFARDCPQGGGGGGRDGCRKCGEEGHFARDCPRGGGGRDGCRKCGEDGHFARDCPQGGGGGGREKKGCFRCGEDGHMAKDCSQPPPEGEKPRENYIPPDYSEDENVLFGSNTVGINFGKYNEIPVEVSGHDPVGFISGFEEAGFYELCMKNVRKANYEDPTPVQKYAIPIIMAGRDLMACAQTGSGKTAAFVLPVITGIIKNGVKSSAFCPEQYPQAVIVAPTRELAVQINSDATKFAHGTTVRSVVVYGGTSVNHQKNQVSRGTNILVGTPGRLLDFIKNGVVNLSKVEYLILDEADRMLDMGFEPDIRRLVENPDMPPKGQRQTLMFSATFPTDIQKLAADFLNNYLFVTVGRVGGANTDVTQTLFEVERLKKRDQLCDILSDSGKDRVLVFVEQKRNADFLATYLSSKGFPTTSIHGDRLQREREEALRDFKSGEKPVLIATSVAARGLDIHDVKHVINYDLPSSIDEYVHRIGRTGRCGNLGRATSFFSADADNALASSLVDILKEAHQEVPDWLLTYVSGQGGGDGGYDSNRFASTDIRRGGGGYSKQSAFSGNDDCESWD